LTDIVLAVHGGAGQLASRSLKKRGRAGYERGLAAALKAGQRVLLRGGSAMNAATEAVASLEDNELFNAGIGAALCADGSVELSASVMRGRDLAVGAMVGLKRTKNPVRAARAIMGHAHGLLFGAEGDAYAASKNLDIAPPDYFLTPMRRRQWEKHRHKSGAVLDHSVDEAAHGTVGAVARDRRGNLAAATSTGGLVNQLPGRVGDTPVIGAGTWADNATCALSATGKGDAFARVAFARRVADLIELAGMTPLDAALSALDHVKRVNGVGGCIMIGADGGVFLPFNTPHMPRGWLIGHGAPHVALLPDEDVVVA
jgi:isoaspartyl peptidase/L-asparaginase-like protein (Ntn-hydrolase superfamily)